MATIFSRFANLKRANVVQLPYYTTPVVRRLSSDSLHLHILRDNIADAKGPLPCANWARGIEVKFAALGMASPFVSSGIGSLDSHGFMDRLAGARQRTWHGLHISPRAAASKGAKLCTYHHWFGRPNKVHCEPYYELPMSITRLSGLGAVSVGVTFFAC